MPVEITQRTFEYHFLTPFWPFRELKPDFRRSEEEEYESTAGSASEAVDRLLGYFGSAAIDVLSDRVNLYFLLETS